MNRSFGRSYSPRVDLHATLRLLIGVAVSALPPLVGLGCSSQIADANPCAGTCGAAGTRASGAVGEGGAFVQAGSSGTGGGMASATSGRGVPEAGRVAASDNTAPSAPRAGAGDGAIPTGGRTSSGAGMGARSGGAGSGGSTGAANDDFESARQACVDTINMYRATRGLPALERGTPEQEACSDRGAKKDGDSGDAHSSAGDCERIGLPGAQNTCPGYPVRGGSTVTATLEGCLEQMWAEGEPSEGVRACIADGDGCFQMHGHWINMSDEGNRVVACGFYQMENGRYWMNQNFGP